MLGSRLVKVATTASLLLAPLFVGAAHAQVDVSNASVTCNTIVKASLKASPALVLGGMAGTTTIKVKGVLGGCTSPDAAVTFPDYKSKFQGVLTVPTNDCLGLVSLNLTSATLTIKWKTNEKINVNQSVITIDQSDATAGLFVAPWGANHPYVGLGVNPRPSGMPGTPLSVSGAFTGGDGGAQSTVDLISSQDIQTIVAACQTATGVKQVDLGLGQIHLQ